MAAGAGANEQERARDGEDSVDARLVVVPEEPGGQRLEIRILDSSRLGVVLNEDDGDPEGRSLISTVELRRAPGRDRRAARREGWAGHPRYRR
jgi:hypothetical protein